MNEKEGLINDEMSQKIIEHTESLVTLHGSRCITVRKILSEMGITNRVFYNRFHNIDQVLEIVYKNMILKIRQAAPSEFKDKNDFFEKVTDLVVNSLIISYDIKRQFNQYIFENDSVSQSNYEWWTSEIKKLIDHAKNKGYIKDVDSDVMSYSICCFCRGYNADAVGRNLPREVAVKNFRYSISFLFEGLKNY